MIVETENGVNGLYFGAEKYVEQDFKQIIENGVANCECFMYATQLNSNLL